MNMFESGSHALNDCCIDIDYDNPEHIERMVETTMRRKKITREEAEAITQERVDKRNARKAYWDEHMKLL